MNLEMICKTLDDYTAAAEKLIKSFASDRVFAFFGEMGAGKTTFIKSICKFLGAEDNAKSPSFAIINEYAVGNQLTAISNQPEKQEDLTETLNPKPKTIFHFDFYRIRKAEEAYDLGYEEYFYSGSYCFIEWPEMISELLPEKYVRVEINVNDDLSRTINISN